jgi:tripartite-type tricarboxylate transporter receptor subunit TctC
VGGQIQVIFPGLAAAMPQVRSGAFKPLAVTGDHRQPLLPDVPTFKELGYGGFDGVTWYGIAGPPNMPEAITRKLNEAINTILAAPDVRDLFTAQALNLMPMSPKQFGAYIADEIAHWTAVARASKHLTAVFGALGAAAGVASALRLGRCSVLLTRRWRPRTHCVAMSLLPRTDHVIV